MIGTPKFIQISCGSGKNSLFALDEEGKVWRYVPANTTKKFEDREPGRGEHFAFWSKLTDKRGG